MKLLEILLHELESWPTDKEYAFQSSTSRIAFFASSQTDDNLKSVILSQIVSNRGPHHTVTRDEWEAAKIKSLPFFKNVANILGEEEAVKELLAVRKHGTYISSDAEELAEAFAFFSTPQGFEFWSNIAEPNREGKVLKEALELITAAMQEANPDYCICLQADGSSSVRDHDDNDIHYFHSAESLVKQYLAPNTQV